MAMTYDSTPDTLAHIATVQEQMTVITDELTIRAAAHDASKLQEPEKSGYDRLTMALKQVAYGSDAYHAARADAAPVIAQHYAANRHHPEHFPDGIYGMNLIDVIEMLCDWKAASARTRQTSVAPSLSITKQRFGINDQLFAILVNTVRDLEW